MTLESFFKKFDSFANTSDVHPAMLAHRPGCVTRSTGHPVVSLRSTTGYRLLSLRDAYHQLFDAEGIPACSRWSSEERLSAVALAKVGATPPDHRPPFSRTPAGVPARTVRP
jgi:hypothetical protein